MKRAKYHIMSQTLGVSVEPLKWPIAPDGYIPNSVIRSWGRKGKELNKMDSWHDLSYSLHQVGDWTTDDLEDVSTRTIWFIQDEEEEEEKTDEVKRKKRKKENEKHEKNEKDKEVKQEVEVKERADEKKEREGKMDRIVLVKQSYDIQTKTDLQNHLKTSDDEKIHVEPQRQEVGSTYSSSSRQTMNIT